MVAGESTHSNTNKDTNQGKQHPEQLLFEEQIPSPSITQQAMLAPHLLTSGGILQLQRTIGNQAVQRLLASDHHLRQNKTIIQRNVDENLPLGTTVKIKMRGKWYAEKIVDVSPDGKIYSFNISGKPLQYNFDSADILPNETRTADATTTVYMSGWAVQKSAWTDTMTSTSFASCVGLALKAQIPNSQDRIGILAHFQAHDDIGNMVAGIVAELGQIYPSFAQLAWAGISFRGNPAFDMQNLSVLQEKSLKKSKDRVDLADQLIRNHLQGNIVLYKDVGHRTVAMNLTDNSDPTLTEAEDAKNKRSGLY